MVLFIISAVLILCCISGFIYHFVSFKRNRVLNNINKQYLVEFIAPLILYVISSILMSVGISMWGKYNMDALHKFYLYFGTIIFSTALFILFSSFTIYYYKPELDPKLRKLIRKIMFISIPFVIVFFVMTIEGYAPYINYPLISGISFTDKGVVFRTRGLTGGSFTINWYGLILLSGAIVAYFVCDHHFYQEYKKHGIIDSLFVLVFIIGVLGARFWSVAVLHDGGATIKDFFKFQGGGLGIMGGVLFGGLAGILFIIFFRKYINLRHAMDMILPCVLIAQAIGRWGNFFNQEVYGALKIPYDQVWWLPTFIKNQMQVTTGYIQLPLFLIESITNLTGYFVIYYAVGKCLDKHLSKGDLFFLYVFWYGLTRVILEPMRSSDFKFGVSYISAWVMFAGGIAAIIGLHIYDYLRWGKKTFIVDNSTLVENAKNPYYKKAQTTNSEVKNEEIKN